jgi:23S rRNA (uracil1939-C5)-methyltransferase
MQTLTIQDVAFGGNGVARLDGKAVFVPFTIDGEVVGARIVRDKRKFAEAEVVEVIEKSPHRVAPECPYFGRCGGCAYQHIAYAHQLEIKARQVEQTLRRVGRLPDVPMQPVIASPQSYGFRSRVRVHVGGGAVGFHATGSHEIVDVERCAIANEGVNTALARLRAKRHSLRDGDYSLWSREAAEFFEQTNDGAAQLLVDLVEKTVRRGQSMLVDAYCGAGLFAKRLAPLFREIVGIEDNERAVLRAGEGAAENERYIAGDVAAHLGPVLEQADAAATTVILDPPATGVAAPVTGILLSTLPAEIIYVSCNPATLARDLAALCGCGAYKLASVTPLDMFPQTAEIEAVAHLTR